MNPRRDVGAAGRSRLPLHGKWISPQRPLILAAVAVLGLTGCGVPGSGPATRVDKVEQDGGDGDADNVQVLEPSTKEVTTVRNFLGASAGDVNGRDKRLAKFFQPGDKRKWSQPSEGLQLVRIAPGGVVNTDDGDAYRAKVTVTGDIVGVFGQNGQVKPWSGDDEFKQTFTLAREASRDVWHLTKAPRQVYLSDEHFATAYRMSPLYFPTASDDENTLVPDPRWLPKELMDSDTRYNQLVDWLLGGPSDLIGSTVSSAFPDGTSRDKAVVTSKNGDKVTVDISADSASQPAKDHKTMSAQLAWTLGLAEDQTLTLSVDGQDRLTAAVSDWASRVHTPDEDAEAEGLAYYIHDGKVESNESSADFDGVEVTGLRQAAVDRTGQRLAAVAATGGGQRLLTGPPEKLTKVPKFSSARLEDPQWFDADTILVIDDGDPVTVDIDTGKRRKLSIDEGKGGVTDLALSPDARRVAYVADGHAWLSAVLPDENGKLRIGDPSAVAPAVDNIGDIGWSRETHLLMIGDVADMPAWLWEASIDGAYLQPRAGAEDESTRAEELAVRCKPATNRGPSDSGGDPVLLQINGIIYRLYSEVSPVQIGGEDTNGFAPFTAS